MADGFKLIAQEVPSDGRVRESFAVLPSTAYPFGFMLLLEDANGWVQRMSEHGSPIYNEMWAWCVEQFGAPYTRMTRTDHPSHHGLWIASQDVFRFARQNDAIAFKLRWC